MNNSAMILLMASALLIMVVGGKVNNTDNDNLYILHTKKGDIKCNYHNSRDLNNGHIEYYDAVKKKSEFIHSTMVDSVTVLAENWLTCGPRNEKLKYINKVPAK